MSTPVLEPLTTPDSGTTMLLDREPQSSSPEVAHIGNKREVAEAYVTGCEIVALCGVRFIPTKDPTKLPVCDECKSMLALGWGPELAPPTS